MAHIGLYGNVKLVREKCLRCRRTAIVLDGKLSCCGLELWREAVGVKRMSIPVQARRIPGVKDRMRILMRQDNRCFYCDKAFGSWIQYGKKKRRVLINWDHVDPYAHSQNNYSDNFVASCQFCNHWKRDKIFSTFDEVRIYVSGKWAEKTPGKADKEMRVSRVQ